MVKTILMLAIAAFSFIGILAGLLAMEGKLSTDTLQQIMNPEDYAKAEAKRQAEARANEPALGTLAQQMNERAMKLDERKMALDEREKQIRQREADLDKARSDLEMLQKSINTDLDAATESRKTQLKTVAITLESMEADSAAKRLETMPTDEIAEILLSVKDKKRGEILEAMSTETAARVMKEILDTAS